MKSMFRITPGLGREKQCTKCGEWWPADTEFFYRQQNVRSRLHAWCIACTVHDKRQRKQRRSAAA